MKTYNFRILVLFFALLTIVDLWAQDVNMDKKVYEKNYIANSGSYVELSNKYGDIEVNTWEKDSVSVRVEVKTFSEKWDWREEMMESIDVDFTCSAGFIVVETTWGEGANFWKKSAYKVAKEFGNNRIEVQYKVSLPKNMPLEIENRFGNVFIGDYDGQLEVKVHHGDFRARRLKNLRNLDIRYGKAKIKEVEQAQIDMGSGSSLDLQHGGELMITSSSSEIEIETLNSLNINSRHDDIYLERPSSVNGSFSLSDLKISDLQKDIKADCKFGSVRIQEVARNADSVDIDGDKTDIIVGLASDFAGRFNIDVDGENDIDYPDEMFIVSSGTDDNKRMKLQGAMGDKEGTIVSISSTNGHVKIGD
ncbi:MAG: hypothetical protein HKN45_07100 [Flavobacteriales bacterium]|nr:hypothetical protein [Flavobacteriales bacterium]NNK79888.1 hypothetical protein [Flavobacteriales bacterium]